MKKETAVNIKNATVTKRIKKNDAENYFKTFYNVLDAVKIGLWNWDLLSGEAVLSRQYELILGFGEGEIKRTVKAWSALILPEDQIKAEKTIDEFTFGGKTDYFEIELRMFKKDGSIIWVQQKGTTLEFDEFGRPMRLGGTLQEIGKFKQIKE